jgi:hypothetical protein
VQQRAARERRAVQRQGLVVVAAELGRPDLAVGVSAGEQLRVTAQVVFEQIDAAAMHGHGRRIGQLDAVAREQLQAFVLAARIAHVGFRHEGHRGETIAMLVLQRGAELVEHECHAGAVERLGRAHDEVKGSAPIATSRRAVSICPWSTARSRACTKSVAPSSPSAAMIRSRPMLAAYAIGGPQLHFSVPRALSCSRRGFLPTISRTASRSPRQMASIKRQDCTSRGQLGNP